MAGFEVTLYGRIWVTPEAAISSLKSQIADGAILIFEGGSRERDEAWWMREFSRTPIEPLRDILGFRVLNQRFPSLSIFPGDALPCVGARLTTP